MSEKHQGTLMQGVYGFERENFEEEKKKMPRPRAWSSFVNRHPKFFFLIAGTIKMFMLLVNSVDWIVPLYIVTTILTVVTIKF